MTAIETVEHTNDASVTIRGLNHVAMPVRDGAEAVRFWTTLFGGQFVGEWPEDKFWGVMMPGGFLFGLSQQTQGWTGRANEYPHVGFDVDPDKMEILKARLEDYGVPTHSIWTRFKSEALMYFRDPSGNLFELYCHEGYDKATSAPVSSSYGGDFKVDLEALNYSTWKDPGK